MVLDQMDTRCPDAKIVSKEFLNDWELEFKATPAGTYLNVIPCKGAQTPVFIWEISERDEENMDEYEDWPNSYIKMDIPWSKGMAMMYVVPETITQKGLPEDRYINPILDVYNKEGYDTSHINQLLKGE